MAGVRRKKQGKRAYPSDRGGLNALMADVALMCDNCRGYWKGADAELVALAERLQTHARAVAEEEWAGAVRLSMGRRR